MFCDIPICGKASTTGLDMRKCIGMGHPLSGVKQIIASAIKRIKGKKKHKRLANRLKKERQSELQNRVDIFRRELEYEETDEYAEALERVRRAIQMAHNNEIQGEQMCVNFIDGYGNQFQVIIGKEEDLLSDDTLKNSLVRERFYFTQRGMHYMAIGISSDEFLGAMSCTDSYSGN